MKSIEKLSLMEKKQIENMNIIFNWFNFYKGYIEEIELKELFIFCGMENKFDEKLYEKIEQINNCVENDDFDEFKKIIGI